MRGLALVLAVLVGANAAGWAAEPAPLALERKIPLGKVSGRIDHMAVDIDRQRLFIAELGNDSLGVVDLASGAARAITGLREPQGVGYAAATDTVYVANARDGSVALFRGAGLAPAGRIDLGDDADNVRVDAAAERVYVGYGRGALAVIDPANLAKIADIPLKAHPEGFQLDPASGRIFVNLPDARQIAVADRAAGKQVASWQVPGATANFPMAVDPDGKRVFSVFRHPARLVVFNAADGAVAANLETCGDADDVFVDAKRGRIYVSCGEGFIDVFAAAGDGYARIGHLPTASGARTSLFVPALDRLYLAVRASGGAAPAIWVFRPAP